MSGAQPINWCSPFSRAGRGARLAILTCLLLLAFLAGMSPVYADELQPYRVAVLGPPPVYSDPNLAQQEGATPNLSRQELNREVFALFDADPRFDAVAEDDIRRADFQFLRDNQVEAEIADMHRINGMEEFSQYDLDTAIFSLEQAVDYYTVSGSIRANPRSMATAYEYLALAYIERAQTRTDETIESRTDARAASER